TCRSVRCLADTSPERARSTTASSSPRSIGADTTASSGWSIARPATPRRDWMAGSREQPGPIASDELLGQLPADWPEDPLPAIRAALRDSGRTFCVLDDHPTGTQTAHDALAGTNCSEPDLGEALAGGRQFFYILTNSRSLPERQAAHRASEAARNLARAARAGGQDFVVGIRGDSTLRGHHPVETWAVRDTLEAEQN